MSTIIIKNCEVLTFEGRDPRFVAGQDILIEGNQISSIQQTSDRTQTDGQVINAAGMLAVPGMINTHAHVPMVLFRNAGPDVNENDWFNKVIFPLEANLTPDDIYWGAMLGLAEMIEAGITCTADHYFEMDMVARAVEKAGTRANWGGLFLVIKATRSLKKRSVSLNAGREKPTDASQPGSRLIRLTSVIQTSSAAAPKKPPALGLATTFTQPRHPRRFPCRLPVTEKRRFRF